MQGHFSTGLLAAFLALTTPSTARAQSFQDGLDQLPATPTGEAAHRLADLAHTLATAPLTGSTSVTQLPTSAIPQTLSAVPNDGAQAQREAVAIFQRQNLGPLEVRLKTGHVYVGQIVSAKDELFFFRDTNTGQTLAIGYGEVTAMGYWRKPTPKAQKVVQDILLVPLRILDLFFGPLVGRSPLC